MVGDGNAADFRQTLIDLEVMAIAAKEREPDRRGVVY
jgi:hypothetical protein